MVQGLHAGTEYTVTINPIFVDIEGPLTIAKAKTCEFYSFYSQKTFRTAPNEDLSVYKYIRLFI